MNNSFLHQYFLFFHLRCTIMLVILHDLVETIQMYLYHLHLCSMHQAFSCLLAIYFYRKRYHISIWHATSFNLLYCRNCIPCCMVAQDIDTCRFMWSLPSKRLFTWCTWFYWTNELRSFLHHRTLSHFPHGYKSKSTLSRRGMASLGYPRCTSI